MLPHVDLVIVFRLNGKSNSKEVALRDARNAEEQYSRLLRALHDAGLRAVGRKGEKPAHLLVFISCPLKRLETLMRKERRSDILFGLPISHSSPSANPKDLTPAERIRLIHDYVTCTPRDGGLGIVPESPEWDLVESIMGLHDHKFNEEWIRSWTTKQVDALKIDSIRDQFGDSVALYFAFLSFYTNALIFPSVIGVLFYLFGSSYSALYSTLLLIWSVVYVEWWRIQERILSLRWGTRGSFRVEKQRPQYKPGLTWWQRDLRVLASIPIIIFFSGVLAALLTAIFLLEAFVMGLYKGPGQRYISFGPTILFTALVPRVLGIYHMVANRLTAWENHQHRSSHDTSSTLKSFALSAIVSYLGLALSAFLYVPFGEAVMRSVHSWLYQGRGLFTSIWKSFLGGKGPLGNTREAMMWESDISRASKKLDRNRLKGQMFAYTVTAQVINTLSEIGLPYLQRFFTFSKIREEASKIVPIRRATIDIVKDGPQQGSKEEEEFIHIVEKEVELNPYDLFEDYGEMVTQFGYVALWSTIWPLAPAMALANNYLESSSDAFKITVHVRRPIAMRTNTIGPWLEALTFLTWLSALTNSCLVYLFRPADASDQEAHLSRVDRIALGKSPWELVMSALLVTLMASHGYLLLKVLVAHIIERMVWTESADVKGWERSEREVKAGYLQSLEGDITEEGDDVRGERLEDAPVDEGNFWEREEGLGEIQRIGKQD